MGVKTKIEYEWMWEFSKADFGVVECERYYSIFEPANPDGYALTLVLLKKFCNWDYGVIDEECYHLNINTWEFAPSLPTKYLQKEFEKALPMIKNIEFISNGLD